MIAACVWQFTVFLKCSWNCLNESCLPLAIDLFWKFSWNVLNEITHAWFPGSLISENKQFSTEILIWVWVGETGTEFKKPSNNVSIPANDSIYSSLNDGTNNKLRGFLWFLLDVLNVVLFENVV